MLLDADGLGLTQEIERVLDVLPDELEGQVKPELLQSVLEIATKPRDERQRGRRGAPRASAHRCEHRRRPRPLRGRVRHPPVRPLGGAGGGRAPPLPGADPRARLHRAARADLRHPRPRGDRGRRPGDLRRRRHPPVPAASARAVGELPVLARVADGAGVRADARLPRLPPLRRAPALRRLGDLHRPGRADDARRARSRTTPTYGGTSVRIPSSGPSRRASSTSRRGSITRSRSPPSPRRSRTPSAPSSTTAARASTFPPSSSTTTRSARPSAGSTASSSTSCIASADRPRRWRSACSTSFATTRRARLRGGAGGRPRPRRGGHRLAPPDRDLGARGRPRPAHAPDRRGEPGLGGAAASEAGRGCRCPSLSRLIWDKVRGAGVEGDEASVARISAGSDDPASALVPASFRSTSWVAGAAAPGVQEDV